MTHDEFKELKERYFKAYEIIKDISDVKRDIQDIEDNETFEYKIRPFTSVTTECILSKEERKGLIEDMRKKMLRTFRGTLINLEQKFKDL